MSEYLKNLQDEVSYLNTLILIAEKDDVLDDVELEFIKTQAMINGVSEEAFAEALSYASKGETPELVFSSKEAAIFAIMAAIRLAVADGNVAWSESTTLRKISRQLGVEPDFEVESMIHDYYMMVYDNDRLYNSIVRKLNSGKYKDDKDSKAARDGSLYSELLSMRDAKDVFETDQDQINFVKGLLSVMKSDNDIADSEVAYLDLVLKLYGIDEKNAMVARKAVDGPCFISTEIGAATLIKEAVRMTTVDEKFETAEREAVVALAKEVGVKFKDFALRKMGEYVNDSIKVRELYEKIEKAWPEHIYEAEESKGTKVTDLQIKKAEALINAPTVCQELKDVAQVFINDVGTKGENKARRNLIRELKYDVMKVDDVMRTMTIPEVRTELGAVKADNIAKHARDLQLKGVVYCDCPACKVGLDLLESLALSE